MGAIISTEVPPMPPRAERDTSQQTDQGQAQQGKSKDDGQRFGLAPSPPSHTGALVLGGILAAAAVGTAAFASSNAGKAFINGASAPRGIYVAQGDPNRGQIPKGFGVISSDNLNPQLPKPKTDAELFDEAQKAKQAEADRVAAAEKLKSDEAATKSKQPSVIVPPADYIEGPLNPTSTNPEYWKKYGNGQQPQNPSQAEQDAKRQALENQIADADAKLRAPAQPNPTVVTAELAKQKAQQQSAQPSAQPAAPPAQAGKDASASAKPAASPSTAPSKPASPDIPQGITIAAPTADFATASKPVIVQGSNLGNGELLPEGTPILAAIDGSVAVNSAKASYGTVTTITIVSPDKDQEAKYSILGDFDVPKSTQKGQQLVISKGGKLSPAFGDVNLIFALTTKSGALIPYSSIKFS